jgi:hypothetical protein
LIWDPQRQRLLPGIARRMLPVVCALIAQAMPAAAQEEITKEWIRQQLSLTGSLNCTVRTSFPTPSFDFRIHSSYQVLLPIRVVRDKPDLYLRVWTVPLKDDAGKPFEPPKKPHVMTQHYRMRNITQSDRSFLRVDGSVVTGAGEYRHFLAVDDGKGNGCVRDWRVKAKPPRSLSGALALKPGEVQDPRLAAFRRQEKVEKQPDGLRVAVMLNADNRSWRRVLADGNNMTALTSTLRRIAEDPRVREIALTVFTLEDQEILYDQDFQEEVNFSKFRNAFRRLKPGEIDISKLRQGSEARFLAGALQDREQRFAAADLLVFVGARSPVTDKISPVALESLEPLRGRTVSYLITNPFPRRQVQVSTRDMVGHAVRALGGTEKEIYFPGDLAKAVDLMLRNAMESRTPPSQ